MKLFFALLFAACSMSAFEVKAQVNGEQENWKAAERQTILSISMLTTTWFTMQGISDFRHPTP